MKNKWNFISAVVQLVIGSAAVLAFIYLAICGEDMRRWIVTFILAVAIVLLGVWGLIAWRKEK